MNIDVNWVRTVYDNGRGWHVGNMVQWNGGILPISDDQALIAYYSSHEYPPGNNYGSNVYLASVSLT